MKKIFKLAEYILIMIIIIIFVVVSIILFLGFERNTRNAVRLKDVNDVIKSFELFSSSFGFLPVASNSFNVTYLSGTVWTQGTVGESITSYLSSNLRPNLVDPLTNEEYTYSLLNNKKEYQIKSIYEDGLLTKNSKLDEKCLIKGNYNGKLASLKLDNTIHILANPSIITSYSGNVSLITINKNKKYLYNYTLLNKGFVPKKLDLYSGSLDGLKYLSNKINFLNNYKLSYSGYEKKDKTQKSIDKLDISHNNYDSDMDDIANKLLLSTVKDIKNLDFFNIKESRFVIDNFNLNKNYEEVSEEKRDFTDRWWLNSGAFFNIKNGKLLTIQGKLKKGSKRQVNYSKYKGGYDTDGGYYPQSLFRLILNKKFKNLKQYAYFKINKYILSESKNRFESNGFLLLSRYLNSDNLYYAGLRVDGELVIKKKYKGVYYTLKGKKVLDGVYDRDKNPNLIPTNKWIGIKVEMVNIEKNKVSIKVYTDLNNNLAWTLVLDFIDSNENIDNQLLNNEGYAGIRTDFMDVEIDKYYIKEI